MAVTHAKLGRNDLCRCGSGKKYKRCCADADREAARPAPPPQLDLADPDVASALRRMEALQVELARGGVVVPGGDW